MKRLWLSLLFVSIPALAATSPEAYYKQLAGHWQGAVEHVDLNYDVSPGGVVVKGEECSSDEPVVCAVVDQDYQWNTNALLRSYPQYGEQPVEIMELTANKMVKREIHPMVPDRTSVTTEELVDKDTLVVTAELWGEGEAAPRARREYTLKRVDVPLTQ